MLFPTPSFTGFVVRESTRLTLAADGGLDTIVLDAGTVLLRPRDDLFIGTKVSADRPFGLFTGSEALAVPFAVRTENRVLQPVAPPSAWASEYAAVKFPDRLEQDPATWRFIARENGTTLSYEPRAPAGAPTVMNAGELAIVSTTESFVVRSQDGAHPFHASQLMPSGFTICELDDAGYIHTGGNCKSVYPQLLTTVPLAEFGQRAAFVTEPFFPDTSLVVTRHADDDGSFRDVILDCAGVLTGWRPVGLGDRYRTTRVALSNAAFEPQRYAAGICDNGAHAMRSDGLFTVAVWAGQHTAVPPAEIAERVPFASNYAFNVYGRRAERDAGLTK
ncbi:MAG: IgGFc-binding protein [Labilithrix sp.]|nr:IgGFc-binding protein [Labilithrix sp.]